MRAIGTTRQFVMHLQYRCCYDCRVTRNEGIGTRKRVRIGVRAGKKKIASSRTAAIALLNMNPLLATSQDPRRLPGDYLAIFLRAERNHAQRGCL